jgi:hypothetical protein
MDVSIRLSLKGGHHWEFVCDEDDPMVFGLISALPGAALDASLPPDGLIQVEARNGQRFFLSRSSLVALTINRMSARTDASIDDAAFLSATPFVIRPDVFDHATIEAILQASACPPSAEIDGVQDVFVDALPTAAVEALVRVLSGAISHLAQGDYAAIHLDLAIHRLSSLPAVRLPLRAKSRRLLDFVIWLAVADAPPPSLAVSLPDRWVGHTDDAMPTVRTLPLGPNTALVFPAANGLAALEMNIPAQIRTPIVVSGSLCEGSGVAAL